MYRDIKTKLGFSRFILLEKYIKNKRVLDIGSVGSNALTWDSKEWLFKKIAREAKTIVGVDINKKAIQELNKRNYDIRFGNAEYFNLGEEFDVAVASELIEHLNNQGAFLRCVQKHLKKDGYLIITTPNCFSWVYFLESLILGQELNNPNHTLWHSAATLRQLFAKFEFSIKEICYFVENNAYQRESKLLKFLVTLKYMVSILICLVRRNLSQQMMIVAQRR
ncbi:MAG: class I SAM-dependent methyltransferase [Candidatus Bathyarchaeota archaeon]|nr:class I SAM-dependent methyltransferase [Candidatus Bathyarchaeota archaeon]